MHSMMFAVIALPLCKLLRAWLDMSCVHIQDSVSYFGYGEELQTNMSDIIYPEAIGELN